MHFSGIIVGAAVFFSIGICHPAVIKMEYYMGKNTMERQNFIIDNLVIEQDLPEDTDPID